MTSETKKHVLFADWFANDFSIESKALGRHGYSYSSAGIDNLASSDDKKDTLIKAIHSMPRVDALVFCIAPIDEDIISLLPSHCLLQRLGTGLDNVDLEFAVAHGNMVRNTPEYCRTEVATHAMALLLCLHRQIMQTQEHLLSGKWSSLPPSPLQRLSTLTLGIIGFGRIGCTLGTYMHPLVKQTMYFDPLVTKDFNWAQSSDIDTLLENSDMLSLHCPLTPKTRNIIAKKTLTRMKSTAILVNAARGGLVDSEALANALNTDVIAGAALDVFEPEILKKESSLRFAKNIILTSHTGWYSEQARIDARIEAMQIIVAHLNTMTIK